MRTAAFLAALLSSTGASLAAQNVDPSRNAFVATQDPLGEPVTRSSISTRTGLPTRACNSTSPRRGRRFFPMAGSSRSNRPIRRRRFVTIRISSNTDILPQNAGPSNPDGLPVGFVAGQGTGRSWLGMTCAACHTAEVRLGTTAYRVDGGPTGGDVQAFLTDLTRALQQTQTDPAKFGRFAANDSRLDQLAGQPGRAQGPAWHRDRCPRGLQPAQFPRL